MSIGMKRKTYLTLRSQLTKIPLANTELVSLNSVIFDVRNEHKSK